MLAAEVHSSGNESIDCNAPRRDRRVKRAGLRAAATAVALAGLCSSAGARELVWEGTLEVGIGFGNEIVRAKGTGVATIEGSHFLVDSLRLAGGIAGSGTIPVTDPEATATIPSFRVDFTLGTGTLTPFTRATLPIRGASRLCLFTPGCATDAEIPLTTGGTRGAGIGGGPVTVGGFGSVRISLVGMPWTIGTTHVSVSTPLGGSLQVQDTGFMHGPSSWTSSAGTTGGVIQLVSPTMVTFRSVDESTSLDVNRLTIRFVPEPDHLALIGSGIFGLVGVSRTRRARRK